MPVMENDFKILADAEIDVSTLACVIVALGWLQMEKDGYIVSSVGVNVDALEGMYYRCQRLKITHPTARQLEIAATCFLNNLNARNEDRADLMILLIHSGVAQTVERLSRPAPPPVRAARGIPTWAYWLVMLAVLAWIWWRMGA